MKLDPKTTAFVFPGQGSQAVGMGKDLAAQYPTARQTFEEADSILGAAERYHIDPALVKAVIWRESRFNHRARGRAGEIGLMQINKLAAEEWAEASGLKFFRHHELYNPDKNILAGSWYLAKLLRRYQQTDNPIPYALADYNAGRSNVLKWNKGDAARQSRVFLTQVGFPSTRDYIYSILKRYNYYKTRFPEKSPR